MTWTTDQISLVMFLVVLAFMLGYALGSNR